MTAPAPRACILNGQDQQTARRLMAIWQVNADAELESRTPHVPRPETYLLPTQGSHLAAPSSCEKTPFPFCQCLKFFSKCKCVETEQG